MRKFYDFSKGVRGAHVERFREGIQVVVTDSEPEEQSDNSSVFGSEMRSKVFSTKDAAPVPARTKNS